MNLTQVKQDIQSRKFSPVYIFTGEEIGVMDIYIQQIAKVSKKQIIRANTFKEIFKVLKSQSIIENAGVYFCRDDAEIIENEKIWKLLENAEWTGNNIVILAFTAVDKRKTFYKRFKAHICEFEPLGDEILIKYIKKQINLSERACEHLIEACEHSYSRIMLEIDKIKAYMVGMDYTLDNKVYNHVLQELLDIGAIYQPAQDSIFLWSDAVMYRQNKKAFDLMQTCFDSGEAVLVMLTVLYNNVKQTLQVKSCDSKDISKSTGLTGWQIQCAKKFVNSYSIQELVKAMHLIREMEVGIKTGKIEERAVIPYVLVEMM